MARQSAKLAQIGTVVNAGTTLLTMGGGPKPKPGQGLQVAP